MLLEAIFCKMKSIGIKLNYRKATFIVFRKFYDHNLTSFYTAFHGTNKWGILYTVFLAYITCIVV